MSRRSMPRVLLCLALLPLAFAASAQTYTQTEEILYYDNTANWTLGQVMRRKIDGTVVASSTFDAATALPLTHSSFGKLRQTLTWNPNGTVATVKDGNNNLTAAGNWKRGIPQTIAYADGSGQSATVNALGWITSVTDETGAKTCYGHDAMGRVDRITYPSESAANTCDTSAWHETVLAFEQVPGAEYGIPAGHWRQTIATGNGRKLVYFDALWRPLLTREYDTANVAATQRFQRFTYDQGGRTAFASYPGATDALTTGTWTGYDALGRVTSLAQDSELGLLVTTTEYLDGFRTRVTNPRGMATVTYYKAYDQPKTDWPMAIEQPEEATTVFERDTFGKPLAITRYDAANPTLGATRVYGYNPASQELCRTVEPETGATLMGYDGAGNLAWSAAGLPAGTACDEEGDTAAILARRVSRTYDTRNRLQTLSFPDGDGNQTWTYTPDGLPASIVTTMLSDSRIVTNLYTYNRRRLLATESQQLTGWGTYTLTRHYDANGHLASLVYPANYHGPVVDYAPNALGQPTKAGTFASAVTYFPNGAIRSFTYGNGIQHTLIQNARGLPDASCDFVGTCDANAILNDGYDYDESGNVAAISDGRTEHRGDRDMTYDALDRLTQAVSPMFGTATYAYDALDNLVRAHVTGGDHPRDHYYCYDDDTWQLTNVKTGGCIGTTVMGLGYDEQGNLKNRSGVLYEFDFGNRLREVVGRETQFLYDGHGRRVASNRLVNGSGVRRSIYSQEGQLLFVQDQGEGKRKDYFYLGGSLIAERTLPNTGAATPVTIRYQHTDALGSPVAITDESQGVVEQTEYEPYGLPANRPLRNGPGYTGHHEDAATGLVYMQQRYYDPMIPRFLSVDPVSATSVGGNFNRYKYASNNPYRFTDPDGRQERPHDECAGTRIIGHCGSSSASVQSFGRSGGGDSAPRGGSNTEGGVSQDGSQASSANAEQSSSNQREKEHPLVFGGGCSPTATLSACGAAPPDYIHVSAGAHVATAGAVLTRNGTLFAGGGAAHGTPASLVSGKVGWSVSFGYLTSPGTATDVDNFVRGATTAIGGYWGPGGAYSYNATGSAIEVGFGQGGPSLQAVEYMKQIYPSGDGE